MFEYGSAFHLRIVPPRPEHLLVYPRLVSTCWRFQPELRGVSSLGMEMDRLDTASIGTRPQHDGSRAVTEQHCHLSSLGAEIEPGRVDLANQEDVMVALHSNEGVGHRETIDETRALVENVERSDGSQPQPFLEQHGRAGKIVVGRQSRKHDEIQIRGLDPRRLDGLP